MLDDISAVARPREVEVPPLTRLNQRYGPALQLGAVILRASSIDVPKGELAAIAFVFDMNKVFEDFVTIALRESMESYGGEIRSQWQGHLDSEKRIRIIPDLSWWGVESAWLSPTPSISRWPPASMPNADAYQMLAYCAAVGLPRGFLIYAKDNGVKARTHSVVSASCSIEVRTLDVEAYPEALLAQVEVLAAGIARSRTGTGWASPYANPSHAGWMS